MARRTLILLMCLASLALTAQTVVLDVKTDTTKDNSYGQNKKNFVHTFFSYGLFASGGNPGAEIIPWASYDMSSGLRYKHKWTEVLSSGAEIGWHGQSFALKQQAGKVLPNTAINQSEDLFYNALEINIYQRFNWGKRGDIIGNFIDLAVGADLFAGLRHHTVNTLNNGVVREVTDRKLSYGRKYFLHAILRAGFNRWVAYVRYRFTPIIEPASLYPALPALSIGVQIGFH